MPFNWNESKPGDGDIVSQFPADERATRGTVKAAFEVEHDGAEGRHKIPAGTTAVRDAITTWVQGSLFLNLTVAALQTQRSAGAPFDWINAAGFPSGTRMAFFQATAPEGWVQDATLNDRLIRVTSGPGGTSGGAWTITGFTTSTSTTGGHALTLGEVPISFNFLAATEGGSGSGSRRDDVTAAAHTHPIPVLTVVNDAAWRPAYLDCIIAVKS